METAIGVFTSRDNAEEAVKELRERSVPEESIVFLTRSENEAKTIAKEIGAFVGGFVGGAAGMTTGGCGCNAASSWGRDGIRARVRRRRTARACGCRCGRHRQLGGSTRRGRASTDNG